MDIYENRRAQLRKWAEKNGAPSKEKSYFSQLINGNASFGEKAARRLEREYGMGDGYLDGTDGAREGQAPKRISANLEKEQKIDKSGMIRGPTPQTFAAMDSGAKQKHEKATPSIEDWRQVPVLSQVQAGMMTPAIDPVSFGGGLGTASTNLESKSAFGWRIDDSSMLPMLKVGDVVVIDPEKEPPPGKFVLAINGDQDVILRKYRALSTNARGDLVFELVPLNGDFPTFHSERDELRIIGVAVQQVLDLLNI